MDKRTALKAFKSMGVSQYGDYWSMQESWTMFVDSLVKDGQANPKYTTNWDNPCTPETFKYWKARNS